MLLVNCWEYCITYTWGKPALKVVYPFLKYLFIVSCMFIEEYDIAVTAKMLELNSVQ